MSSVSFVEARADRAARKAARRIAGSLDEGEDVEIAAVAVEGRHPMHAAVTAGGVLVVVSLLLALDGRELRASVIGLSIGLSAAVAMAVQSRWIVLTDRRVLFFKAHALTTRPTRFLESHARAAVLFKPDPTSRWGWWRVEYRRPTGSVVILRFQWAWEAACGRLSLALAAPPPPLAPSA